MGISLKGKERRKATEGCRGNETQVIGKEEEKERKPTEKVERAIGKEKAKEKERKAAMEKESKTRKEREIRRVVVHRKDGQKRTDKESCTVWTSA